MSDAPTGEAWVPAEPDEMPTPEEEAAAERAAADQPEGVAEAYEEMAEIGAELRGEGQIDGGER